jgi:hypothetical protein
MKMDIANKVFETDQRKFLVDQLKLLKDKLGKTNTSSLHRRDVNDIIGTSYNSLYRSSMYYGLNDGYLIDIQPNTTIEDAIKIIHTANVDHPHVIVLVTKIRIFEGKVFAKWLRDCGNWFTELWFHLNDVVDMIQKCVSSDDYDNNNIVNAIDWDPHDSAGAITKSTAGTNIVLSSLPSGMCPAGSNFDLLLTAGNILGGQASVAKRERKDKGKNKCLMPIYYINYNGNANGVACNVFKYLSQRGGYIYNADMQGSRPDRGVGDSFFRLYNRCNTGYDLDEFPMNGMNNGYDNFGEWDVSVLCVTDTENRSEGGSFGAFRYGHGIWSRCDPDDPNSPMRDNLGGVSPYRLVHNQQFLVQIKNIDYTRCSATTQTATLESRSNYNVRYDPNHQAHVGTFWVNNQQTHSRDYFEIMNKFTKLDMP